MCSISTHSRFVPCRGFRMLRKVLAIATIVLMSLTPTTKALEVFGNGGDRSQTGTVVTFFGDPTNGLATPFTTGTSTDLNKVQGIWVLVGNNTSSAAGFDVRIYDAQAANAGPTGTALATASASRDAGAGASWIFADFGTPVQLDPSSDYYVSLIKTSGTANQFGWYTPTASPDYSDLGSNSGYTLPFGVSATVFDSTNSGTSWNVGPLVSASRFGFQVVPEPSTYVLSGLAVGAIAVIAKRRKRSVQATKPS